MKPLEGVVVLEFCQYLSGPSATLRLADLGARVIKIERPGSGDGNRRLSLGVDVQGDSLLFHTINRDKESYAVDLKDPSGRERVRKLVATADVIVENFRPGVMKRLGLDYESVRQVNPGIVFGRITGYGDEGPWRDKPGQDLLVQSLSGLPWLNGNADQPPLPFGLAVADLFTGAHLAQGILACLVRRGRTGEGGLVEVSLMESILDLQVEVFTTYLNDGGKKPQRSAVNGAHAYLPAPYGIYATQDGYLALAMGSLGHLACLIDCPELLPFDSDELTWNERDKIKGILQSHLAHRTTADWLSVLEPADFWCANVLTWPELEREEAFNSLNMVQVVKRDAYEFRTTRCPVRIDGELLLSRTGAPTLGADSRDIEEEFSLSASDNRYGRDPEGERS